MKKTQNYTFLYFGIKCALLFFYYSLLQAFGLDWKFKFWSYIILTPIVKYFYLQTQTTQAKFPKLFITSVLLDSIFGFWYFHYLYHWTGYWLVLFPYVVIIWITANEYFQYMILGEKDETYVIKLSNNPSDFFLFPIITSAFVLVAFYNPNPHIFTPVCFLVWALILVTVDFTFGFLHTLCHTHPYLRKLHMVHHEYRREDLNSFATFYSDFTDALFMNTPGMTNAILSVMFSLGPLPLNEMGISLGHTHHKYPNHQMTLCYFFEFDLIDMIMDRVRLSNYHHLHHHLTDQNFGVYGFISDEILLKGNQYIKSGYQSFVRSSKLYTYFKKGLSN